jgi:hypothetical protein
MYATMSESDIMAYVTNLFTFFHLAYTSNSSTVLIVCHQFFTWIALDDVDLCFSLILLKKKTNGAVGETTSAV